MNLRYAPPVAFVVGLKRLIAGQVHLDRQRIGDVLVMENGEQHQVFREVRVDPGCAVRPESAVTLTLRFRFARLSQAVNKGLSLLPIPVIIGMPGFLQKTWTWCGDNGYSQGIYRFETAEDAEAYLRSAVIRALKKRTVKGSFSRDLR